MKILNAKFEDGILSFDTDKEGHEFLEAVRADLRAEGKPDHNEAVMGALVDALHEKLTAEATATEPPGVPRPAPVIPLHRKGRPTPLGSGSFWRWPLPSNARGRGK